MTDSEEKPKEVEKHEEEIVKVSKWDGPTVRMTINDVLRKEISKKFPWTERQLVTDIKLLISLISVLFAAYACYYDWYNSYPKSKLVITICAPSYFVLMGVLWLYTYFIEGNAFYYGVEKVGKGGKQLRYWKVSSEMGRYDDKYTLIVTYTQGERSGTYKITKSIGSYITEEGQIVSAAVMADLNQLINEAFPSEKKN
uniref:Signal peptidase complex subunit 2 n=1 Tax=Parastrongyloides trichosuri TaxID=131310 RepID=A0A0N4ZE32_PARTI